MIAAFAGALFGGPVLASTIDVKENLAVLRGEEILGDYYAIGGNTTVAGSVTGDLVAIGASVFAGEGPVGKSALLIGDTVQVITAVGEDLRFLARNLAFSGSTKGDIAGAALTVEVLPQAVVGGDLLAAAGTVTISGAVEGDVRVVAGRAVINGTVGGDLTVSADSVIIGPSASVAGAFRYSASAPAVVEGTIEGPTTFNRIETRAGAERFVPTFLGMWVLVRFATLLLFALAAHGLLKAVSRRFVSEAFREPGWSIARGFALFIAVPAAALVGALTFIGIPFSFFIFLLYGLALIIGAVYAPIILGSAAFALYRRERTPLVSWKTILAGVLISMSLSFIPYVGPALRAVAFLAALGAIFQVTYRVYIHARERDE